MNKQKKSYSSPKVTFERNFANNVLPAALAGAAVGGAVVAAVNLIAPVISSGIQKKLEKGEYLPCIPSLDPVVYSTN